MARVALDHSLLFHRLQEARQELFQARAGSAALSSQDRARLIARCEANVASTERQFAQTIVSEAPPLVERRPASVNDGERAAPTRDVPRLSGNVGAGFQAAQDTAS